MAQAYLAAPVTLCGEHALVWQIGTHPRSTTSSTSTMLLVVLRLVLAILFSVAKTGVGDSISISISISIGSNAIICTGKTQ